MIDIAVIINDNINIAQPQLEDNEREQREDIDKRNAIMYLL